MRYEFLLLESYVDGTGEDEVRLWEIDGDSFEGSLAEILDEFGEDGWYVVGTAGGDSICEVLLSREVMPMDEEGEEPLVN